MSNDIQIGTITIHVYGIMIALGLLIGYFIAEKRASKNGYDTDKLFNLFLACMLGCIIGGKLLYCIVEFDEFIYDPIMLFDFQNGFVIYGGLIGGFFFGYKYCQYEGIHFFKYFEWFIPSLALAQGIGRIGCLFAGCCYGKETNAWFGITYTNSLIAPNNVSLIPTQLMMSIFDLCLAVYLFILARKKPHVGIQTSMYIMIYSIARFLIEFLRDDDRGMWGFLSTSQYISILTLLFGIILFIKIKKSLNNN